MSKVIIISNTSWNLFNFRLPLMSRLREEGYEIVAVAPFDEYANRLSDTGFRYIDLPMNNKGTNPVEDVGLAIRLFKLFRSERPDVVLTYTPKPNIYASIAGGFSGTPVIPNISGLGATFIRQDVITKIIKFLYRWALRYPPRVFFQNHDDMNQFIALGLVKEVKTQRIPGSGINTTVYAPEDNVESEEHGFVFLLVARMLWDKGVGEYVEAARIVKQKYPNARFQLLGFLDVINPQAISREQMQKWVDEGVVEYLGVSDDVKSHMQSADCVVLPSYREGLPRTLIEAGSLAKPIVTTDVPGCRDVVDNGVTGYLCEVKNACDLADKMERMICLTSAQRRKMGESGREKVEREFDEKIVINCYLKELELITGNKTNLY
ncbi:glycosyltransferase family 4 protein [Mariprofundus sp. NF]|uniref:glycosyltransferase family 4 protein n=1 Tax=Mariprofundus sp. NF TaxID=2608716 RepID=UPI0015A4C4C3|nr:glycosyltransferase family 4 protein [Mariprofundus sp. NF]NWF39484.1 glycosyltransferase family 4 protein [Mariprofundus sp. NF]